jgi:hypothetical protein
MFEEIPFVLGFLVVSLLLSVIFFKIEYKPLKLAVQVVAIIGIIVHEISHVLMCFVTNTKINNVTLLKKVETDKPSNKIYGGQVNLKSDPRISFLQALVVGLAPLFVSFWFFFFLYRELSNPNTTDWMAILYVFLMVSLILGSAPSKGDLYQIGSAFTYDIGYTFKQIFLVAISILSVWILITINHIPMIHESITYFFILIGYYALKYAIKGVIGAIKIIFKKASLSTHHPIKHKRLRRLYRHNAPKEKEAQW